MNSRVELSNYLEEFSARLKRLVKIRGAAVIAILLLLVSVTGGLVAIRAGFADNVVTTARLALLLLGGTAAWLMIWQPLSRLDGRVGSLVESRTPEFGGRVETWLGMQESSPLKELLAEDTLQISARNPVAGQITLREFVLPAAGLVLALVLLIWLAAAGPGLMNYAVRHIWAGWAVPNLLPPQTIVVTPGDEAIRRGGSVRVTATMEGFNPPRATVHTRVGNGEWQQVEMADTGQSYEFMYFSLREPLTYYVSSAGIRSQAYDISVVDLPDIAGLKLTYNYPEWTNRNPDVIEPGGDIRTLLGTRVDVDVTYDGELDSAALVLNDRASPLQVGAGHSGSTSFEVTDDGSYYIAATVGGEQVRLSDDYFITVVDDAGPKIRFTRPGRDWNASNIEEVTAAVEAEDDYALESVSLRYSVNGGEWQSVELPYETRSAVAEHVFFLENMGSEEPAEFSLFHPLEDEDIHLQPGDLVSYYAVATDREQTARTDMFFIEVQQFERRFTQSQQAGGGGGGQGQGQQEISQRQKEIILSTWNLIREQSEPDKRAGSRSGLGLENSAALLSELQLTLSEQAQTLADRTRARQLTSTDPQIAIFVENLEKAAEAMLPAADRLAEIDLEEAIQPEQQALQYLLRAESEINDMQVSFGQGRGGGGGQAGRDLAEMYELEMDLEKNQYETGSTATPQSQAEEVDESMRQLEELARRQEQIANNLRSQRQNLTPAQRWQQESLRREAEELQQRIESMLQSQGASAQSGQQQGSQGQQGEQGQQSGDAEGGTAGEASGSELSRRLASAIRAMNESAEAMQENLTTEEMQRAAEEAQRQLEGARNALAEQEQRSMQESFEQMAGTAGELYRQQERIDGDIHEAMVRALDEREQGSRMGSGLSPEQEQALSEEKLAMQATLQALEQQMQGDARRYRDTAPEASDELDYAVRELREAEVDARLGVAADYIEFGATPYIASSESAVTEAFRELEENLRRVRSLSGSRTEPVQDNIASTLEQSRTLREQLQLLANGGQPVNGLENEGVEAQSGQGQPGEPRDASGQASGNRVGGNLQGGGWQGGAWAGGGSWDRLRGTTLPLGPETWQRIQGDLSDLAAAFRNAGSEYRYQGLSARQLNEIRELADRLEQMGLDRNSEIILREYNEALNLLEQLEFRLAQVREQDDSGNMRTAAVDEVPAEYQETVAEYYRRLSRGPESGDSPIE